MDLIEWLLKIKFLFNLLSIYLFSSWVGSKWVQKLDGSLRLLETMCSDSWGTYAKCFFNATQFFCVISAWTNDLHISQINHENNPVQCQRENHLVTDQVDWSRCQSDSRRSPSLEYTICPTPSISTSDRSTSRNLKRKMKRCLDHESDTILWIFEARNHSIINRLINSLSVVTYDFPCAAFLSRV